MSLWELQSDPLAPGQVTGTHTITEWLPHDIPQPETGDALLSRAIFEKIPGLTLIEGQTRISGRIAGARGPKILDLPPGMGKTLIAIVGAVLRAANTPDGCQPLAVFVCPPTLAAQWEFSILRVIPAITSVLGREIRYSHNPTLTFTAVPGGDSSIHVVLMSSKNRNTIAYYRCFLSGVTDTSVESVVTSFKEVITPPNNNRFDPAEPVRRCAMRRLVYSSTHLRAAVRCVDESHLFMFRNTGAKTQELQHTRPHTNIYITATFMTYILRADWAAHYGMNNEVYRAMATPGTILHDIFSDASGRPFRYYASGDGLTYRLGEVAIHISRATLCHPADLAGIRAAAQTLFRDRRIHTFTIRAGLPVLMAEGHTINDQLRPEFVFSKFLTSLRENIHLAIPPHDSIRTDPDKTITLDWLRSHLVAHAEAVTKRKAPTAHFKAVNQRILERTTALLADVDACYNQDCMICAETFSAGTLEPAIQTCCLQMPMCTDCAERWRRQSTRCPICRRTSEVLKTTRRKRALSEAAPTPEAAAGPNTAQATVDARIEDTVSAALRAAARSSARGQQPELNTIIRHVAEHLAARAVARGPVRVMFVVAREDAAARLKELLADLNNVALLTLRASGTSTLPGSRVTWKCQKKTLDRFNDLSIRNLTILVTLQGHLSSMNSNTTDGLDVHNLDGVIYVGNRISEAQGYQTRSRLTRMSRLDSDAFMLSVIA
jgi:hypothetical protein